MGRNDKVKIEVDAAVEDAQRALGNVDKSIKGLEGSYGKVGDGFSTAGIKAIEFNNVLKAGSTILDVAKQGYDHLVTSTVNYASQVKELSRATGASVEESSRMIQVADDAKIEFGDLSNMLQFRVRKGLDTSIEGIAKLSDEYIKLAPGLERANFLTDNFGRSGKDIAEFMELGSKGIREMSDAVADNMVLTEKQVEAARNWERNLDDLGDTIQGVKYDLGNALLPVLNQAYTSFKQLQSITSGYADILADHESQVRKTSQTYEDYVTEMARASRAAGKLVDETGQVYKVVSNGTGAMRVYTGEIVAVTRAEFDATKETEKIKTALIDTKNAAKVTAAGFDEFASSLGAAAPTAKDWKKAMEDLNQAGLNLINDSMKPLTKEMLYQKAAAGLDSVAALDLAKSMGLVNEKTYGTMIRVQELRAQLDAGKITIAEYTQAIKDLAYGDYLVTIRADFSDLDRALAKAAQLNAMGTANIQGPSFSWTPPGGGSSGSGSSSSSGQTGVAGNGGGAEGGRFANGGSFVIPSKYGYEGYPLGPDKTASAGETVTVTPAGQAIKGDTYNIYALNPAAIVSEISRRQAVARLMA
jgi:hypothetical protein